jgi:hypothetical protein
MSDTPRTDAVTALTGSDCDCPACACAKLARALERELANASRRISELERQIDRLEDAVVDGNG